MHLLAVVHGIRFDIAKSVHEHFGFNSSFAAFATLNVVIRHKN